MTRTRTMLVVASTVVAAGCGHVGFDASQDGYSGPCTVDCVTLSPVYPQHAAWNAWIKNNNGGTNVWNQPDESCIETEPGTHNACLHGGELRVVEVPDRSTCNQLTAVDALGAFDWRCDDANGVVVLRSTGLRDDVRVAALLEPDGTRFRANYVRVLAADTMISATEELVWWDNPIVPLPPNPTGSVIALDGIDDDGAGPDGAFAPGTIFTLDATRASAGYNLNADRLALIVMPNATLRLAASPASNCNISTGDIGPVDVDPFTYRPCLVAAGSQTFVWLEGAFDSAPGGTSSYDSAILLANVRHSVLRGVAMQNGDYGLLLHGTTAMLVYDLRAMNQNKFGVIVSGNRAPSPSRDNVLAHVSIGNAARADLMGFAGLLLEGGSTNNVLSHIVATAIGSYGVLQYGPGNHANTWTHLTVANVGWGIDMEDGSPTQDTVLWNALVANVANVGVSLDNQLDGRFAQFALFDVDATALRVLNASAGSIFNGTFYFGSNATDCTACDLSAVNVIASSSLMNALVGRGATAAAASITDWIGRSTLFESWGPDAVYPSATAQGRCESGTCATWDWRLLKGADVLLDRSGDGLTANPPFVVGAPCPAPAAGDRVIAAATGETYLRDATEVFFDARGNEDGLCESGEACIYSPNFGAYQGEGDYRGRACTFVAATVTGVELYAHPTNGL